MVNPRWFFAICYPHNATFGKAKAGSDEGVHIHFHALHFTQ